MEALTAHSVDDTQRIASSLIVLLKPGDCITLSGDLGAGKTAFSKGFISAFSSIEPEEVTSPTFTLCQEYPSASNDLTLYHYDLYRLEDENELEELGLEEQLETGVVLVEWPEIATAYFPKDRLEISIRIGENDSRMITFAPKGNWAERLPLLRGMK